jgi:hypothetical protein
MVDRPRQGRTPCGLERQRAEGNLVVVAVGKVFVLVVAQEAAEESVVSVRHAGDGGTPHRQFREDAAVDDIETWTADECATAWGVKTPTWLGYVSRGHAPQPLADRDDRGRHRWDADAVRTFPRPGPGRSWRSTGSEADQLLSEMREVAGQLEELRERQKELLIEGKEEGLEIRSMAQALGISRQTAYSWLGDR